MKVLKQDIEQHIRPTQEETNTLRTSKAEIM